jgi:hypothetical protein
MSALVGSRIAAVRPSDNHYINWAIWSSAKRFLFSPKWPDRLWGSLQWEWVSLWGQSSRDVMLAAQLFVTPRLRMNGAVPLFHLCAFFARTGRLYLYLKRSANVGCTHKFRSFFLDDVSTSKPCQSPSGRWCLPVFVAGTARRDAVPFMPEHKPGVAVSFTAQRTTHRVWPTKLRHLCQVRCYYKLKHSTASPL